MRHRHRILRNRRGQFELRLPQAERSVLRWLPVKLREELAEPEAPGLERLFPPAHPEEPRLEIGYRELVHDELLQRRLSATRTMEATMEAKILEEEQLLAWLSVVNDVRLIIGTRLGADEDEQEEDVPEDDPRAAAYTLYHYLGWLEEQMVQVLAESLSAEGSPPS